MFPSFVVLVGFDYFCDIQPNQEGGDDNKEFVVIPSVGKV